jgi:hypothetical protein
MSPKTRHTDRTDRFLPVLRSRSAARALILVASWALVMRALIPLVLSLTAAPGADRIATGGLVPICHIDVSVEDPSAQPNQDQNRKRPIGPCPVCPMCPSLHIAGILTQPSSIKSPRSASTGRIGFMADDHSGAAAPRRTPAQPRAPPFVAA